MKPLRSHFRTYIDDMIRHKTAMGYSAVTYEKNLHRFDEYCYTHFPDENKLTKELIEGWARTSDKESINSLNRRLATLREFGRYLQNIGLLKTHDVNLDTGMIYIREAKHHKDRTVVLSDDVLSLCVSYNLLRENICGGAEYFFPDRIGKTVAYLLDDEETDKLVNANEELFLANAKNEYGYKGTREAQAVLDKASVLFAGGELDDEAKDIFFQNLMEVYLESKAEACEKFAQKRRKSRKA